MILHVVLWLFVNVQCYQRLAIVINNNNNINNNDDDDDDNKDNGDKNLKFARV